MTRISGLGRFLWDFVIGDDWRVAVAVVVGLAVTGLVAGTGVAAWWILPLFVAVILTVSVLSVARRR
jgi:hypothetical protein